MEHALEESSSLKLGKDGGAEQLSHCDFASLVSIFSSVANNNLELYNVCSMKSNMKLKSIVSFKMLSNSIWKNNSLNFFDDYLLLCVVFCLA